MSRPAALPPDRLEVLERIRTYEARGGEWFFQDVENDPPAKTLHPEDVDYLHETAKFRLNGWLARLIEAVCQAVCRRKYAITVLGGEHLSGLPGGAVLTSNHFAVTENLAVRAAAKSAPGRHRMYKLVREGNYCMPGVIGWLLRYADTLPLSSCVTTMKLLDRAVTRILQNGDFLLVYPEQAMWWYYPKPRPYRIGAFRYAAKNGVPVVPCFVTLSAKKPEKPLRPDNVRYTVHVCPPIYPHPGGSVREEAERMREENFRACRSVYEEVYRRPLCYGDGETVFSPGWSNSTGSRMEEN